jgi:hypothetical protein
MHQLLCFAGLAAITGPLHADSCAGGLGRGMDITGNECNDPMLDADDAVVVLRSPITANVVREPARTVGGASVLIKTVATSHGAATAHVKGVATSRVAVKARAKLADGAGLENVAAPRAPVPRSAGIAQ